MESNVSRTSPSNFAFLPKTFEAIADPAIKSESYILADRHVVEHPNKAGVGTGKGYRMGD